LVLHIGQSFIPFHLALIGEITIVTIRKISAQHLRPDAEFYP